MGLRWKSYPLQIIRMYSAEQRTKAIAISESPPIPSTWNFPLFMIFATEDWTQGWELHRPSTRPSSSNMLIVAAPAALPAGSPPAGSGWFRRKMAPISPWSWTSVRFSAGVVRRRLSRPGETPACCGVSGRFGLRNRPEVAGGVRSC